MEQLTIIYKEADPDVWNAMVIQHPYIVGYRVEGLEKARETMYHLVEEELFQRTKSYNSWKISREMITYLGAW